MSEEFTSVSVGGTGLGNARFYVYLISSPDGSPCYIGKGCGKRWLQHSRRSHNPHLEQIRMLAGGELSPRKIADGLSEVEAFELEKFLIQEIGRADFCNGPLMNATDGGEGWGLGPKSENHAAKIGEALRGRKFSPSHIQNITTERRSRAPQMRAKALSWHAGLTRAQRQSRATKISEATRVAMKNPVVREKIRVALRGRKQSPERVQLMKESVKKAQDLNPAILERKRQWVKQLHSLNVGRKNSEESKARMRAAAQRREARKKGIFL